MLMSWGGGCCWPKRSWAVRKKSWAVRTAGRESRRTGLTSQPPNVLTLIAIKILDRQFARKRARLVRTNFARKHCFPRSLQRAGHVRAEGNVEVGPAQRKLKSLVVPKSIDVRRSFIGEDSQQLRRGTLEQPETLGVRIRLGERIGVARKLVGQLNHHTCAP